MCKKNVEGTLCGTCKAGFGFLNENDPFGCSSGIIMEISKPLLPTAKLLLWQ